MDRFVRDEGKVARVALNELVAGGPALDEHRSICGDDNAVLHRFLILPVYAATCATKDWAKRSHLQSSASSELAPYSHTAAADIMKAAHTSFRSCPYRR